MLQNLGKINYTGNSGKLYIGNGCDANNIQYTGSNGAMKFINNKIQLWFAIFFYFEFDKKMQISDKKK